MGIKCIILDLDNTLLRTFSGRQSIAQKIKTKVEHRDLKNRIYELPFDKLSWGIRRPYLDKFINFIFETIDIVCVWSAGGYEYVHEAVKQLFTPEQRTQMFIYTRDDCEKDFRGNLIKPILKMLNNVPGLKYKANLSNTIIVDDLITTFSQNPDNAIHIPEFNPSPTYESLRTRDVALLQLMTWISFNLNNPVDIRNVDKSRRTIFSLTPRRCNDVFDLRDNICELVATVAS